MLHAVNLSSYLSYPLPNEKLTVIQRVKFKRLFCNSGAIHDRPGAEKMIILSADVFL